MNPIKKMLVGMACLFLSCGLLAPQLAAQGTAFTYQGRLNNGGAVANGQYDLSFALYDAPGGGNALGAALTNLAVGVTNGLFAVTLDFGAGPFSGTNRWLEIGVRTNGSAASFTTLSPRQQTTATLYAIRALAAGTATTAASVTASAITGTVSTNNLPANLAALVASNGANLTNLSATNLTGTVPAGQIIVATVNCVYVSPAGSDVTGNRTHLEKPFLTLAAAKSAAQPGDTILVYPGVYNDNNLLKDKVNWYFFPGATNHYTGPSTDGIFDDQGSSITATISGAGVFIWESSNPAGYPTNVFLNAPSAQFGSGVLVTSGSNTCINFTADTLMCGGSCTIGLAGSVSAVWCYNAGQLVVNCNVIKNLNSMVDEEVGAVYWNHGNCTLNCPEILMTEGPCIIEGSDDSTTLLPYGETSLYVNAAEIINTNVSGENAVISTYSYTDKPRLWINCPHIADLNNRSTAYLLYQHGNEKIYINSQKIDHHGVSPVIAIQAGGNASNAPGMLWLTAAKVSSKGTFLDQTASTFRASVLNWEDQGGMTGGFLLHTNANTAGFGLPQAFFQGGQLLFTNAPIFTVSNGATVVINGLVMDNSKTATATNYAINAAGGTVTLLGGSITTPANSDAIYSTNVQNVTAIATRISGGPIHSNVTLIGTSFSGMVLAAKGISTAFSYTHAGTTGAQTINQPSGSVRVAAGGTSVVLTNNLITANSVVLPVIATHDATAFYAQAVPAPGSCTFYLNAAATAETEIRFTVINQ